MGKKPSIKLNLIANYMGSFGTALLSLVFMPIYIRILGPEGYGLVGFFISLLMIFAVLDMGLSQTLTREMARLVGENVAEKKASTAKTFEVLYWGFAFVIFLIVVFLAEVIALHWLKPKDLNPEDLRNSLMIIGLVLAMRWPVALYAGGLNGLQQQVQVNTIHFVTALIQHFGAATVIAFYSPTVGAFFSWQVVAATIQVLYFRFALSKSLGLSRNGKVDFSLIKTLWKFAGGVTGATLLATLLTQMDKILLSKMLSLSDFGYYAFGASAATLVLRLVGPVYTAYYPKLTEHLSLNDESALKKTYHQGCQVLTVFVAPAVLIIFGFSEEIVMAWTKDEALVSNVAMLFGLLAVGNGLNGLVSMPYSLQLASGWSSLPFKTNLVAVLILAPAIYFAVNADGAMGAAKVWILLNAGYFFIYVPIMHTRLLKGQYLVWLTKDVLLPSAAAAVVTVVGMYFSDLATTRVSRIILVVTVYSFALIAAASFVSTFRDKVLAIFSTRRTV